MPTKDSLNTEMFGKLSKVIYLCVRDWGTGGKVCKDPVLYCVDLTAPRGSVSSHGSGFLGAINVQADVLLFTIIKYLAKLLVNIKLVYR